MVKNSTRRPKSFGSSDIGISSAFLILKDIDQYLKSTFNILEGILAPEWTRASSYIKTYYKWNNPLLKSKIYKLFDEMLEANF